jgi:uncharacterized membrane protein YtjA (UPF0391 family)
MLRLAILFAIIAVVAAALGFCGLSDVAATISRFFALILLLHFVIALLVGVRIFGGTRPSLASSPARPARIAPGFMWGL